MRDYRKKKELNDLTSYKRCISEDSFYFFYWNCKEKIIKKDKKLNYFSLIYFFPNIGVFWLSGGHYEI